GAGVGDGESHASHHQDRAGGSQGAGSAGPGSCPQPGGRPASDCGDQGPSHYNRSTDRCRHAPRGRLRTPRGPDPDRRSGVTRIDLSRRSTYRRGDGGYPTGGDDAGSVLDWGGPVSPLFGTDGIRGVANEPPLMPDLAYRVGRELAATLAAQHGSEQVRVVIARDPRRSGPLLEAAMVAGLLSAGADCFTVGVLPTPGIALLTRALEGHGGVVPSASHNPFEDNGIKLFSSEGTKFPDAWEAQIEARLAGPDTAPRAPGAGIGRASTHARGREEAGGKR